MNPGAPAPPRHPWLAGARPRTLPAAVVPVVVGTAAAYDRFPRRWGATSWLWAALALAVALGLQVGVNYANDYSDGVRGTDDARVGPLRLVASGLKEPRLVRRAAFLAFGSAALCGLVLSAFRAPWLIPVGAACILAGWFYTGGSHPYGYAGFGELSVFVFFGVVATVGSAYVETRLFSWLEVVLAVAVGSLAVALLVTNNLRDIAGDAACGKRTLAVRMGDRGTRLVYAACVTLPFAAVLVAAPAFSAWWLLAALAAFLLAVGPLRQVLSGAEARALVAVLAETGRLQMAFGALAAVGLVLSSR